MYALTKLLKVKNFRSDFRRSLRAQVEGWLDADEDEREHGAPLSNRQFAALLDKYTARDARGASEAVYRACGEWGVERVGCSWVWEEVPA